MRALKYIMLSHDRKGKVSTLHSLMSFEDASLMRFSYLVSECCISSIVIQTLQPLVYPVVLDCPLFLLYFLEQSCYNIIAAIRI